MKVVISVVLAGLLGLVNAKVQLTNSNFDGIEAGSTFEITWSGAEGPVTLTLKNGSSDDLQDVETITTNASGDSFEWAVDPALVTGDYAIEIDDGTDVNYSQMFSVDGVAAPSSSTVSSTVSATSSTASPSSTSSESTSTESTSTESTTTASSTTTTASSSSSVSTTVSTSVTRTTSSTPSATTSDAAQTSVPNSNDARSMAAPLGLVALIGAALL
ncbi:Ser-Thr-rich glycosyl-phosphatidyl-inositol-anchored membrane family-domain-containing protein [Nemania abortiva]|nr:Ser-Thr-rich glycosyl-phosphatidyl-inositol-anchored membrane family-domain-containing protein [Nemania abortiva]